MKNTILSIIALTSIASLLSGCAGPGTVGGGAPVFVYGTPVNNPGTQTTCGCAYAGYVTYTNTTAWGWTPDTASSTVFTAADGGGRTDTFVIYNGRLADKGCAPTMVTIPNPPHSTEYRFCIYFPNNVPTTNYPIILSGFNQ